METAQDTIASEVLARDEAFFDALIRADDAALDELLAEDFLIVDVMSGQVAGRDELLGLISGSELQFVEIARQASDALVRCRGSLAVVVGRTRMHMRYQGGDLTVLSRYTHVFTRDGALWRLMSAQGTRIAA